MIRYLVVFFLAMHAALADGVIVQFDPANPQTGPFPTDFLTVADASQLTGKRVNLPLPDCTAAPALCSVLSQIDQMDGFNVQPLITVSFSGPVDPATLRGGIYFVALDNLARGEAGLQPYGQMIAINQVIWDPATNTASAKPDAELGQHSRYLLVVTDAVHDTSGNPVTKSPGFTTCIQTHGNHGYCRDLARGLTEARSALNHTVAASIFTTLSVTAWMESARRQLQSMPVVVRHPDGQSIFTFSNLSGLSVNFDVGAGNFAQFSLPVASPAFSLLFGNLGRIAFGSYLSPMLLNGQQTIEPSPSGVEVDVPTPMNEINFHVYLPNTPPPPNGYPVVILGHGLGDSSIGAPTVIAPSLAQAGFATIAINAFGHGFGPKSSIVLTDASGNTTTLPLGGRGLDRDGNGMIDATEGCLLITPTPTGLRDCIRQTSLDLMQLVRVIQSGVDLDGDGTADLDRGHIYYAGQSFGSLYGAVFNAVEPSIRAAVLNVGGGSVVDIMRWSPGFASTAASILTSQNPPLLPPGTPFTDNWPFRDQPVAINGPGNSQTQYYLELMEWLDNVGDPVTFAPHLSRSTLANVPARSVLFQMARGDRTVPNATSSNLVRAAGATTATWMYRHDLAQAAFPGQLPQDPHSYLALFLGAPTGGVVNLPSLPAIFIGLAAQSQVSGFFASDGTMIPDMNQIFPGPYFEIPVTLPSDNGYSQ